MSEVISFRLDGENPREAKALHILKSWQNEGYPTRHILAEALLKLDLPGIVSTENWGNNRLDEVLDQLDLLCKALEDRTLPEPQSSDPVDPKLMLSNVFVASIKQSIKPGIRCINGKQE